jgi:hypothetical protein
MVDHLNTTMEAEKAILLNAKDLEELVLKGTLKNEEITIVTDNVKAVKKKTHPQGNTYHVLIPKRLGKEYENGVVIFVDKKE